MNHKLTLVTTSLLSILLSTFHITDDIVRGFEPGPAEEDEDAAEA